MECKSKTIVKYIDENIGRGLFAACEIKKGELIEVYDGEILTDEEFLLKYPAIDRGKIIHLTDAESYEVNPCASGGDGDDNIVIVSGPRAGEVGKLLDEKSKRIQLVGYHLAHHTLELQKFGHSSIYIDSENKHGQVTCKGAYANSADLDDNSNTRRENNARYQYWYDEGYAIIVATRDILAGEEILVHYEQNEMIKC